MGARTIGTRVRPHGRCGGPPLTLRWFSMASAILLQQAIALAGRFPALAGVDLAVDEGELILLSGSNGAGKTSLLRLCAGLLEIHSGRASVLGHDLRRERRAIRSRVGYLAHSSHLYDDLTVEENVRFAARAGRVGLHTVEPALERLGLAGRLRTLPLSRCSAGQRRRASLAALLVRQPELWLLDEPHAGLDADGRDLLDGLLVELRAHGATLVVASHEPERVWPLGARWLVMAGGRLRPAASGAPAGGGLSASGAASATGSEPARGFGLVARGAAATRGEPVHVA